MVEKSELLRVPTFADLPDDQLAWFISQAQELRLKAGDTFLLQGSSRGRDVRRSRGRAASARRAGRRDGHDFADSQATITGVLPFSRMKIFGVTGGRSRMAASCNFLPRIFPSWCRKCRN